MNRPSPSRRAARGLGVALAVLVGLEGLLRLLPEPDPAWLAHPESTLPGFQAVMMRGNPYLLWELNPGTLHMEQGDVTVDQHGFRGPERGPKTRTRVMVLGDSSVYGAGVGDSATFSARLEAKLGVDFVNAAVPGYSTEQALNTLHLKGFALDPDVLLVATLWSDNNFDRFVDHEVLAQYAAAGSGSARQWLERSRIFGWVGLGAQAVRSDMKVRTVGWMQLDRASQGGRRRVPIADYAANLARFCSLMAERGGGVVFTMLPNRNDITHAETDPPWMPYRQVMRDTAAACGAPLVDLPALYGQLGGDPGAVFSDEMHPNGEGHRRIAEAIEAELAEVGWPGTPLRARAVAPVAVPADPFEGRGVELGLVAPGSPLITDDGPPPDGGGAGPGQPPPGRSRPAPGVVPPGSAPPRPATSAAPPGSSPPRPATSAVPPGSSPPRPAAGSAPAGSPSPPTPGPNSPRGPAPPRPPGG